MLLFKNMGISPISIVPAQTTVIMVRTDENRKRQQNGSIYPLCQRVRKNQRETEKPPLRIWKNPNFKSGEQKKKPQDSGESWVNLMAEDEGFDLIKVALRRAVARNSPPDCCILNRSNPHQVKNTQPQMWLGVFWQRMRDSNPRERSQSPVCYRYTNPLSICL